MAEAGTPKCRNGEGPIQIIHFQQQLTINEGNLHRIFEAAGSRRVVTLAIAGPPDTGFFLNFVIRYFSALEKDETDWMGWEEKEQPLEGFQWDTWTPIEQEPAGIMAWSRPFIINSNGNEVAVVIFDTQFATELEMNAIVGLSVLSSSILILNSSNGISEDLIKSLETYVAFGQLQLAQPNGEDAMDVDPEIKPFQKLLFLVRDWTAAGSYTWGCKGGKAYLKETLKVKGDTTDAGKRVRMGLEQCFNELDCCLLPRPGDKMKEPGFNGSLAQLSSQFCKKLEELVSDLLDPDAVPVKSIFGSEVMGVDMIDYIKAYVRLLNDQGTLEATKIYEVTVSVHADKFLMSCFDSYKNALKKKLKGKKFLDDAVLLREHQRASRLAIRDFTEGSKLANNELREKEEEIAFLIKEEFVKMDQDNRSNQPNLAKQAEDEAISSFKELVNDEFADNEFLDARKLKVAFRTHKDAAIFEFEEKLSDLDEDKLEEARLTLDMRLEEEMQRIEVENVNRKAAAEKKVGGIIRPILKYYQTDLESKIEEDPFISLEDLIHHDVQESRPESEERFASAKKPSKDRKFLTQLKEQFEADRQKVFESIVQKHELSLHKEEEKADQLLQGKLVDLEETLNETMEEMEVKDENSKVVVRILNNFENSINKDLHFVPENSKMGTQLRNKFRASIKSKFDTVVKSAIEVKRKCEESYQKASDKALALYVQDLNGFLSSGAKEDQELYGKHLELLEKSMRTYEVLPKSRIHPKAEEFHKNLESKIFNHFESVESRNKQEREKIQLEMRNAVLIQEREYQSAMVKNLELGKDQEDFNKLHEKAKKEALGNLTSNYVSRAPPSFLSTSVAELLEKLETTFQTELKDLFEMELKNRESGTTSAIIDSRRFYREEMEKHYNNAEFMRPEDLEDLHEKMAKLAIYKCKEKTPLTQIQLGDLSDALLDTFKSYKEQNDMNMPTDEIAIGIDLGTTYSCVAVYVKGQVKVLNNFQGKNTTPSFVSYNETGGLDCVGDPAKDKAYENAENTVFDAKRILGRQFNDRDLQDDMKFWPFKVKNDKDVPMIDIGGKLLYPEQVSSEVLKEMKKIAESYLQCKVKKAVITVPAYFTDGQRQATVHAGELAGLDVLNILTEPVAASVAYKLQHSDDYGNRHVLIFDLGGGTFDVAVLKMSKGEVETLGLDGDSHLGGEDFDQNMMKYCAEEFNKQHSIDLFDGKDSPNAITRQEVRRRLKRLQFMCEKKKIELASCRSVDITVDAIYNNGGTSLDLKVNMTRDKFEEINEPLFQKTIDIVKQCLGVAGINKASIHDIVLVGGSTRIPKVQDLLSDFFEGRALNRTINQDEAVAIGAAVQAAVLNGQVAQKSKAFNIIKDATPMSLGVEVYGGEFSVIIPKNTKVPIKFQEQYYTAHNNQTSVQVTVYQGEDPVAKNNSWLGEFVLNGVPPAEAGKEAIDVTMEINLQGILHVTAVCTSTGSTGNITIKEHKKRLQKDQIKRILDEAKSAEAGEGSTP